MQTRTLITGGAGFIGAALAARCMDMGQEVHVLVRDGTPLDRLAALGEHVCVHRVALSDADALRKCLALIAPEQIFHLAAETRLTVSLHCSGAAATALQDCRNLLLLLELLADLPAPPAVLVRAGSIAEYGPAPLPYREDQPLQAQTPYAAGLAAGTECARLLQPILPYPVITARLALTYGPQQSDSFLIPTLIKKCLAGEPHRIKRPEDRRDLLHIDDAVDALCRLAATPAAGGTIVNIATGIAPSMGDVARLILEATGQDPSLITLDDQPSEDGISELRASSDLALALIGWRARISLPEGIGRTVAALRQRALELT